MSHRRARLAALALAVPLLLSACEKEAAAPDPAGSEAPAATGVDGARAALRSSNATFELTVKDVTGATTLLTASGAESPGLVLLWKQTENGVETDINVNAADIWTKTTGEASWGTGWAHYSNQAEAMTTLAQYGPSELAGWLVDGVKTEFQDLGDGKFRAVLKWSDVYPDLAGIVGRMVRGTNVGADRPVKTSDLEVTLTDGRITHLAVVSGEVPVLDLTLTPATTLPEAKPGETATEVQANPVKF